MTYQLLFEQVRRNAPDLSEPEFLASLNAGQKMFCELTKILEGDWRFTTKKGEMYYPIDKRCVGILQADLDGKMMDKFGGDVDNIEIQN